MLRNFSCSLTQISIQPIAFRHADVVKKTCLQLKASIRMGKEEDVNVLVSMVGDQCLANCDSHHITTICRLSREHSQKREKYSVSNGLM